MLKMIHDRTCALHQVRPDLLPLVNRCSMASNSWQRIVDLEKSGNPGSRRIRSRPLLAGIQPVIGTGHFRGSVKSISIEFFSSRATKISVRWGFDKIEPSFDVINPLAADEEF